MNFLEIDNVELRFKSKSILNSIYLKAEIGEVTGILGSNGSGKSNLLRISFGEVKPSHRLIRIDNKPILKPLYKTNFIKSLPQFSIFPKGLTLEKCFYYYDASMEVFFELFPDFQKMRHQKISLFSGGERRLIEIYLTLNSDSKIILLDEPFSHLAPIYVSSILKLVNKIKKEKIIIITDHLYEYILDISDKLYFLKDGWMKEIQSKDDLIFNQYIRE